MELSILVNFVEGLILKILKIWEHSKLQKKKPSSAGVRRIKATLTKIKKTANWSFFILAFIEQNF